MLAALMTISEDRVHTTTQSALGSTRMQRVEPLPTGTERELLIEFLDYQRATVLQKASGLNKEQLAVRLEPSSMTLGGIVKHLALVEDFWFDYRFLGSAEREPWASVPDDAPDDWEFTSASEDEPADLIALYTAACDRSRATYFATEDLGQLARRSIQAGKRWSLRWMMLHMIEETARHAGHMDLIRESIDGKVGE